MARRCCQVAATSWSSCGGEQHLHFRLICAPASVIECVSKTCCSLARLQLGGHDCRLPCNVHWRY
jgi:hypothetical protein